MLFDDVMSELGFSEEQIVALKVCVVFILVKLFVLTGNVSNTNSLTSVTPPITPVATGTGTGGTTRESATKTRSTSETRPRRRAPTSIGHMEFEFDKCWDMRLHGYLQESYQHILEQTERIHELQLEIEQLRRERDVLLAEREALLLESRRLETELNTLRQQLHDLETTRSRSTVCPSETLSQSPLSALIHRDNKFRIILCDTSKLQQDDAARIDREFLPEDDDYEYVVEDEDSGVSDSEDD